MSYQHLKQSNFWLAGTITGSLIFPAMAMAQSPGGSGGNGHQSQPVLTLALVLTSLVLFFFYLFQKNKSQTPGSIDDRDKIKTEKHFGEKTKSRDFETDRALLSLFEHHDTPMAKFTLSQGQIIDANPSFCLALGYTKHEILKLTGSDFGLLPEDRQSLMDKGWEETATSLFNKATNEWVPCQIINIVILADAPPMVLSIVRDMPPTLKTEPEHIPSQLDNVISARISGESS